MQDRKLMMVDVVGLHKALLDVPLTAATAFPIYSAVGLLQGDVTGNQDHLAFSPRHMSDHEAHGSDCRKVEIPQSSTFPSSGLEEPLDSPQSTPLHL
jgi:hypothetical protein